MHKKRIAVIGAGPSGMMASIRAANLSGQVTLFEKNPFPGKKLLLSGKGRCNITNACDLSLFLARFSGNGEFLRDAFQRFFYPELVRFFQERGLKFKIERQSRVFPVTDSSSSVLGVLKRELSASNVEVLYNTPVRDIIAEGSKVGGVITQSGARVPFDAVILATGGVSYPFTGSTGEGLKIAEDKGHSITPLRPGLIALKVKEKYCRILEGLTLKNIRLKFKSKKKDIASEVGEMVFTSDGISGPLVLSLSGRVIDLLDKKIDVCVAINLKPGLSTEQLDNRLLRDFRDNPKKDIRNIMKDLLPLKLVGLFLSLLKIDPRQKGNQVTLEARREIVNLLTDWRLDITGSGPIREAMVTRGGISLKEINPRTMESRVIKGLYFCGEIMDIDADTGGFNLQAAFSTGYLAGECAARAM
mgnify:CR=1 FL=1